MKLFYYGVNNFAFLLKLAMRMTNQNGKYYGNSSTGPVRVRVENAHKPTPGYKGSTNNDHLVDHVHVEHRMNGSTGKWGNPKTTIPQSWLGD
ncbi:MAG: hypothetical protein J6K96_00565 [Treponema sp.]|nr:hypothetical protein [Treponema sp.]